MSGHDEGRDILDAHFAAVFGVDGRSNVVFAVFPIENFVDDCFHERECGVIIRVVVLVGYAFENGVEQIIDDAVDRFDLFVV